MMKHVNKRLVAALGLAAVITLALTACGEKKPSQEEVEQAIEAGTLTVDDALEKGWIDQAWADSYLEDNSVPAADKMEANKVADFATTTLNGGEFTRDDLEAVVFFAFADPADPGAPEFFQSLVDAYEGVAANGAGIVLCTKSGEGSDIFAGAPFPVIVYNDSLQEAVGGNRDMIEDEETPNTASWYVNGSFYSAWSMKVEAEDLIQSAASFVEMSKDQGLSGSGSSAVTPGEDSSPEVPGGGSSAKAPSGAPSAMTPGGTSPASTPSGGTAAMAPMG